MESRDSSSVSASINREMTTNEYCVVSAASVLAKDAALLFKSQKFTECFEVLDQISQKEQHDPKVLHNSAITKYLRDGCLDPHKLLEVLNNVRQRSQEITQALSEKPDDVPDAGNKFTSNIKGNNFIEPPQVSAGSNIIYRDECDSFIAILNMATIWFNLHEYRKALSYLEPLFQNIEPIDEKTALHICLLLLDVALACNDAHKAAEVIMYMEKAFGLGPTQPTDPVPTPQPPQQPSAQTPKSPPPPPLPTTPLPPTTDTLTLDPTPPPERDVSDDAFSYDTLLSTLDSVIGVPGSVGPYSRASGNPSPADLPKRAIPLADLKLKLQLYRVRLLLLTKNLKAAKREVKLTMNIARGSSSDSSSSAALILKSQLEYTRGNHRKAVKLLMASGGKSDAEVLINNNLGCIYYHLGKPHTSSVFFSRSLLLISSLRKEKPPKTDKSHHLLYNCGVQYLSSSKPDLAFRCFHKAVSFFSHRPLLWLRMAECCLTPRPRPPHTNPLRVLGQGASRQLAIENPPPLIRARPELSTATARECLLNALHLLEKKTKKNTPLSGLLQTSVSEHESYCRREDANMKRAILADLSYVDLELGNPSIALYHATLLLSLSECSKTYAFLGRMYAAEALCLLHRHTEAAEQLRTYLTDDDGIRPPFSEQEWGEVGTEVVTPDEARGILYVDLAVMYAAQGDAEKAGWFISRAPEAVVNRFPEAVVVHVYVDLMMHRNQDALQKLRCGKSMLFLPQNGAL